MGVECWPRSFCICQSHKVLGTRLDELSGQLSTTTKTMTMRSAIRGSAVSCNFSRQAFDLCATIVDDHHRSLVVLSPPLSPSLSLPRYLSILFALHLRAAIKQYVFWPC